MIKILSGPENYLIDKFKESCKNKLADPDISYMSVSAFDSDVVDFLQSYSLFDNRRVVVVNINSLNELDNPLFRYYMDNYNPDSQLIVVVKEIDLRTKFAKELKERNMLQIMERLSNEKDLVSFINYELKQNDASMDDAALKELIVRENYFDNTEVNLLMIANDIKNLSYVDKNITADIVKSNIFKRESENAFLLSKLISNKNAKELRHQVSLIPNTTSDAIKVLSLLLREYRIIYKSNYYSLNDIGVKFINKAISKEEAFKGMEIIESYLERVKSSLVDPATALFMVSNELIALRP